MLTYRLAGLLRRRTEAELKTFYVFKIIISVRQITERAGRDFTTENYYGNRK